MPATYAELHSHTNFSFLHGASPVEDMAERAAALGLSGLAVTDHDGLYGVVRFATAAEAAGIRPIIGVEIELQDAAAQATILVAASVVVTAILVPLVTAWTARRVAQPAQ